MVGPRSRLLMLCGQRPAKWYAQGSCVERGSGNPVKLYSHRGQSPLLSAIFRRHPSEY